MWLNWKAGEWEGSCASLEWNKVMLNVHSNSSFVWGGGVLNAKSVQIQRALIWRFPKFLLRRRKSPAPKCYGIFASTDSSSLGVMLRLVQQQLQLPRVNGSSWLLSEPFGAARATATRRLERRAARKLRCLLYILCQPPPTPWLHK